MQTRLAALVMLALAAFVPTALASGKKENKTQFSLHLETDAATDNPKMVSKGNILGKERSFRRMPEVSTKDVLSFSPFPSDGGGGDYGVVFKFKPSVGNRLAAVTTANQGQYMLALLNGRLVDAVMVDKQVNDNKWVVWRGVTLQDIQLLDQEFPRIGEEGKKKKKKDD